MKRYWFLAKKQGWGWYPSKWQGWTVIFLYVAISIFLLVAIDSNSNSIFDTVSTIIPLLLLLTILLIVVCYITGERPKWNLVNK